MFLSSELAIFKGFPRSLKTCLADSLGGFCFLKKNMSSRKLRECCCFLKRQETSSKNLRPQNGASATVKQHATEGRIGHEVGGPDGPTLPSEVTRNYAPKSSSQASKTAPPPRSTATGGRIGHEAGGQIQIAAFKLLLLRLLLLVASSLLASCFLLLGFLPLLLASCPLLLTRLPLLQTSANGVGGFHLASYLFC